MDIPNKKPVLYATFGIPGAGKSTWAKAMVKQASSFTVRVSTDELKEMLHPSLWQDKDDSLVRTLYNTSINIALKRGYNVVADSTNIDSLSFLKRIADKHNAEFYVIRFDQLDIQTCLNRNNTRSGVARLDEAIIYSLHEELQLTKSRLTQFLERYSYDKKRTEQTPESTG